MPLYKFTIDMQVSGDTPEDAWAKIQAEPHNFIPYYDCMVEPVIIEE